LRRYTEVLQPVPAPPEKAGQNFVYPGVYVPADTRRRHRRSLLQTNQTNQTYYEGNNTLYANITTHTMKGGAIYTSVTPTAGVIYRTMEEVGGFNSATYRPNEAVESLAGRCRSAVSKRMLKTPMLSAISA